MFTQIAISTLQNGRLNRGYYLLLYVLPYLCTFAPSKITFAAVFLIMYVCAYLIYREKPKTLLFDVCSRFPSYMYVCTIFRFWYVCSRLFDTFQLSRLFLNKVLCLVFRSVCTRFQLLFLIQINSKQKTFWEFRIFPHLYANVLSFYFLFSRFFYYFG